MKKTEEKTTVIRTSQLGDYGKKRRSETVWTTKHKDDAEWIKRGTTKETDGTSKTQQNGVKEDMKSFSKSEQNTHVLSKRKRKINGAMV